MKRTVDGPGTVVSRPLFLTACWLLLPVAVSFAQPVSFLPRTNFPVGNRPDSVAVGDFNGDGRLDLAVANFSSNTVVILLGTGTGAFSAPASFPGGSGPMFVAVGDFNGDGRLDL